MLDAARRAATDGRATGLDVAAVDEAEAAEVGSDASVCVVVATVPVTGASTPVAEARTGVSVPVTGARLAVTLVSVGASAPVTGANVPVTAVNSARARR